MKIVGYMEGTNPELLTNLMLEGFETLPLSNGWDNHGKYIAHVNRTDNLSLVVGYVHKFIPVAKELAKEEEILSSLKVYKIPTVFIVPSAKHAKTKKILSRKGLKYKLADPAEVSKVIMSMLRPARVARKRPAAKKKKKKRR
jgi:hypothetical protein